VTDLFRKEAVEYARRGVAGEVILAAPLSLRVLMGLPVVVVVLTVAFLASSHYARTESVSGWVTTDAGLIRVAARSGGVVQQIFAHEGDEVAADQTLATLKVSQDAAEGDSGAALLREIQAEVAASQAQAAAAHEKLEAQGDQLRRQRAVLAREVAEGHARAKLMDQRAALGEANVSRDEKLAAKGFLSQHDLESARESALSAQQDASEARTTTLGYQRQLEEVEASLRTLPLDIGAADAQARVTSAGLAQKQTTARSQALYSATATVAGQVVAIPVERGQSVAAGAAVAVLTPKGSHLEAELYAPSRAAGFIKPGQEVRLKYQAFPYQKFGAMKGVVASVSRTVLAPSEVAIPGLTVQEPVFRVRVTLPRTTVTAYAHDLPIQPGMLLTADIVIDRRTLFEWLLDPLYAVSRRV